MAENPGNNQEAEVVRMPYRVSLLYRWVSPNVLGAPSILNQGYLDELKGTGVIFGGGELERRYKVEAAHWGERVCYMNLDHPTKPHWLWVNEVMFTEFGIRVPFTDFQQRLLRRACVAPSQLHPNAWASIRCFELVTEWLELPQEPEGRYFKIFPVGEHRPFWLSLEGEGRFPSYWTDRAGFDVAPVTYKGLRVEQKDMVDILIALFAKNNLAPKALLGRLEEARKEVVTMAGNNVSLNRLRGLVRRSPSASAVVPTTPVVGHAGSGPSSTARGSTQPAQPTLAQPIPNRAVSPSSGRRSTPLETSAAKRQRTETSAREFSPLDRSFDASKFIAENLLGPKTQEALRDYDPVESFRWVQWAMLKSATIMKSVEPRLTMMDEAERHNQRLVGDMKALNLQKTVLEEQLKEATVAKGKAEEGLKSMEKNLEVLRARKDEEISAFQGRIKELESEVLKLKDSLAAEKARADVAEGKIPVLEKQRDENVEDAKAAIAATEGVLKEQLAVLIPDFDVSRIGFLKEIVDGQLRGLSHFRDLEGIDQFPFFRHVILHVISRVCKSTGEVRVDVVFDGSI
ncbi:hypothetical protein PIB30_024896 [Stylosanthes scabra]|uniref:Transposase (Putative), gypsy type n=1 Tax=Stylosanthes scabra TaxID=79078 RepID=A0ABU6S9V9_9FABA|nr:hypothetical protein [Stylosanthes scabra]